MREGPLLQSQFAGQSFVPHIQGLRALAVLVVLIHHIAPTVLPGGFLGVDVFFVISGFLITSHIEQRRGAGRFDLREFYFRRLRRILPNQIAVIAAVLIAAFVWLDKSSFEITAASAAYSAAMMANVFFLQNSGYFAPAAETMPLLHMWSLAVEEQFYLIWPLTLTAFALMNRRWRSIAFVIAVVALIAVTERAVWSAPNAAFYMMPFRILEFGCGAALVYWRPHSWAGARLASWAAPSAMAILLVCLFVYTPETRFPGLMAMVPCTATAALIVWGGRSAIGTPLSHPWVVALGDRSYALYLVHWPVIVFLGVLLPLASPLERIVTILGVTLVLTEMLYRLCERPLRYWRLPSRRGRRVFAGAVMTVMAALTLLGGALGKDALLNGSAEKRAPSLSHCANGETQDLLRCEADILVVGDSFGLFVRESLASVSDAIVARSGFAGCPPVFGAYKEYGGRRHGWKTAVCRQQIATWERNLAQTPAQTIVLTARWARLTEETDYAGRTISPGYLVRSNAGEPTPRQSRRVFREQLEHTVRVLTTAGKRVILIGQPPLRSDAEVTCAKANAARVDVHPHCVSTSSQEALNRLAFANDLIRDLATRHPNVRAILSSDAVCDPECALVRNGVPLYKDSNHLSDEGAVLLAPDLFGDMIAQARR
ncbi:MAG: acyltransferase family protein [Pseudomonadota bacterium]